MKSLLIFTLGLRCRLPPKHLKSGWFQRMGSGWLIMAILLLAKSACGLDGHETSPVAGRKITRLPTLTRTPLPTLTPAPGVNPAGGAGQTPPIIQVEFTPSPMSPLNPTVAPADGEPSNETVAVAEKTGTNPGLTSPVLNPSNTSSRSVTTPTPLPTTVDPPVAFPTTAFSPGSLVDTPGWTLNGAQLYPSLYTDGLLLYGQVTNNTGSAQALNLVTATFLDAQGQLLAAADNVVGFYWPVDIVPVGGTVPFELTVEGIQNAAAFKLIVEAEATGAAPRQDFEFIDLSQRAEDGDYCLGGGVRNPGGDLKDYLTVAAVVYDDQNRVISLSDYYKPYPEEIKADQTLEFDLCIDLEGQNAARHELLAWGE